MNNREQQVIERMERDYGWIMLGLGGTISAAGVLSLISATLLESARRMNASFYSTVSKLEVDPGIDPTTVALGAGGLAMMGGGAFIINQGLSIREHLRNGRDQ